MQSGKFDGCEKLRAKDLRERDEKGKMIRRKYEKADIDHMLPRIIDGQFVSLSGYDVFAQQKYENENTQRYDTQHELDNPQHTWNIANSHEEHKPEYEKKESKLRSLNIKREVRGYEPYSIKKTFYVSNLSVPHHENMKYISIDNMEFNPPEFTVDQPIEGEFDSTSTFYLEEMGEINHTNDSVKLESDNTSLRLIIPHTWTTIKSFQVDKKLIYVSTFEPHYMAYGMNVRLLQDKACSKNDNLNFTIQSVTDQHSFVCSNVLGNESAFKPNWIYFNYSFNPSDNCDIINKLLEAYNNKDLHVEPTSDGNYRIYDTLYQKEVYLNAKGRIVNNIINRPLQEIRLYIIPKDYSNDLDAIVHELERCLNPLTIRDDNCSIEVTTTYTSFVTLAHGEYKIVDFVLILEKGINDCLQSNEQPIRVSYSIDGKFTFSKPDGVFSINLHGIGKYLGFSNEILSGDSKYESDFFVFYPSKISNRYSVKLNQGLSIKSVPKMEHLKHQASDSSSKDRITVEFNIRGPLLQSLDLHRHNRGEYRTVSTRGIKQSNNLYIHINGVENPFSFYTDSATTPIFSYSGVLRMNANGEYQLIESTPQLKFENKAKKPLDITLFTESGVKYNTRRKKMLIDARLYF